MYGIFISIASEKTARGARTSSSEGHWPQLKEQRVRLVVGTQVRSGKKDPGMKHCTGLLKSVQPRGKAPPAPGRQHSVKVAQALNPRPHSWGKRRPCRCAGGSKNQGRRRGQRDGGWRHGGRHAAPRTRPAAAGGAAERASRWESSDRTLGGRLPTDRPLPGTTQQHESDASLSLFLWRLNTYRGLELHLGCIGMC